MKPQEEIECFSLLIEKMSCASCVSKIEKALCEVEGVVRSSVNFATGQASVDSIKGKVSREELINAVAKAGYAARHVETEEIFAEKKDKGYRLLKWRMYFSAILSLPLVIPMFFLFFGKDLEFSPKIQLILATIVQFGGGWVFYKGAYFSLKAKSANMDVLVVLGTSAAFFFSAANVFFSFSPYFYFETSSVLITLILVGKVLEYRSKLTAQGGMRALLKIQVKNANVRRGEEILSIPAEEVRLGDIVIIKSGERIPVDGEIIEGESLIDESMLTGESLPVQKEIKSKVFSGTINGEGKIEIKAEKVGRDTALGHIIRLVEEAQRSKAPIQNLVDRISSVFVPSVLIISVITFFLWVIIVGDFREGMISAIATLVVACPCALGLATPTVIMVACGKGAGEGILIKDASALERASKIQALVIDKTGTVTEGALKIEESYSHIDNEKFIEIAGALTKHSSHPLSKAIFSELEGKGDVFPECTDFKEVPGKGARGRVNNEIYFIGSSSFIKDQGAKLEKTSEKLAGETRILVLIADKEQVLGYFALSDKIRDNSKEAVQKLKKKGVRLFLLSGDREAVVAKVAKEINVDGYYFQVLPEEKASYVEKLKGKGFITGMVGDGVNDAPALAAADVGFAIATGTDVAMESASIGLMRSDLMNLFGAINLSRLSLKKIHQNLFFAFIYNILLIPLAAFGLVNPILAGAAMALSSVSVILNAITLSRKKID